MDKEQKIKKDDKITLTDEEAEKVVGGIQSKDFFSEIADVIKEQPSIQPKTSVKAPKPYL